MTEAGDLLGSNLLGFARLGISYCCGSVLFSVLGLLCLAVREVIIAVLN